MAAQQIISQVARLEKWLKKEHYAGYDPFDGLNSPFFDFLPKARVLNIFLLQFIKRFPFNIRPFLRIKKEFNAKEIGLLLSAYVDRYALSKQEDDLSKIKFFSDWLIENRNSGYSGSCWGYNFDWPNKAFFVSKGTPNIVVTTFVAQAFLDVFRHFNEKRYLQHARSACDFILQDLHRTQDRDSYCFSYTPIDTSKIHNVNMLAAALLSQVYYFTREVELLEAAQRAVLFTLRRQNDNGSWFYGEAPYQRWIDSFHTGYILMALSNYMHATFDFRCRESLEKGFRFLKDRFIDKSGFIKYYFNRQYPFDTHCAAVAIIVLVLLQDLDEEALSLAERIALLTISEMQDKEGYFYYQKHRFFINRIPYIRWSQAWMFRALICLMRELQRENR